MLEDLDAPVDWLVLGDSSCNQGVVPAVLSEELGGRALNLCTIGPVTMLHQAMMLEVYLARVDAPRAILLVNSVRMLSETFNPLVLAKAPVPWGVSPAYRFSTETIAFWDQAHVAWARHLPLYYDNRDLRTILRSAFVAPHTLFKKAEHVPMTPDGYMMTSTPGRMDHMVAETEAELSQEQPFAEDSVRGVQRILALAAARATPVYSFTGPLFDEMNRSALFRQRIRTVEDWWRQLADRTPHLVRSTSLYLVPLEGMGDDIQHVTHDAAVRYTREIARDVRMRRLAIPDVDQD
jgi:hypothetical protein